MAGSTCRYRVRFAMSILASCGLCVTTTAHGGGALTRGLGAADSTRWFAPASTTQAPQGAKAAPSGVLQASLSNGYGVGAVSVQVDPDPGNPRVARLDTTWSTAIPGQRDRVRLGDSVNHAGTWGRQLRFGGLHYGTDLVSGLSPAPWDVTGADLGSHVAPALVRSQQVDRAFAVGFLRRNYGLDRDGYGAPFASATVRWGASEHVTTELRGSAQRGIGNGGIALLFRLKGVGLVTAAVAASDSHAGTGSLAQTGFEYRRASFSASLCSAWASSEFRHLRPDDAGASPRQWSAASASFDAARYGVFGIGYAALAGDAEALGDAFHGSYRISLGRLSTLTLSASRTLAPEPATSLMLVVAIPLDRLARPAGARGAAVTSILRMLDRHSKPTTLAHSLPGQG
jgi:outer membrane usher protein